MVLLEITGWKPSASINGEGRTMERDDRNRVSGKSAGGEPRMEGTVVRRG